MGDRVTDGPTGEGRSGHKVGVDVARAHDTIDSVQRIAYLLVLTGAIATTAVVMSPIAYHRILFRRGRRP